MEWIDRRDRTSRHESLSTMTTQFNRRAFMGTAATALLATGSAIAEISTSVSGTPKGRTVRMVARKFDFVPGKLTVRKGEQLTLLLTAPEVPMGINFSDFNVRADIVPGQTTRLQFTPDKAGEFTFVCDVFCGAGHEDMSGTLVVSA